MGQQIESLARFAATTGWHDVPPSIQARVKLIVLDTIGVILAGSLRPEVQSLRHRLMDAGGMGATILAPGMPSSDPRTAAWLNAIAGRSVELCDGLRGLQPAVHILPGVLALAEKGRHTGRDLLTAFLMGYELAGRLVNGFTPRPFAHPNGQVALLGCAAAGARLSGLDAMQISLAMRIATTTLMTPSYTNTVTGATALNVPAGLSAWMAVMAPDLAASGFHAQDDAIEDALGRMVGSGFDPTVLTEGLGHDWQIADSYFRFYACCNPIHPALDCLQNAVASLGARAEQIERIDVETYAFASIMRDPAPCNYFASKYSLPHAAAVLLVRGGLGFAELDDSALTDPAIAALRHRVHITEDAAMTTRLPASRPARVAVVLKDGRSAVATREMSRRDQERPDPEPEVRAKFRQLAGTVLTDAGIDAVEAAIDNAEDLASTADLIALLRLHAKTEA